jgi:hypothetical protein
MSEPKRQIFPTSNRSKHSKEVSYPIGAEALSCTLDGVPQHDLITCSFYAGYPQYDDGKPQFHVLHVMYRKNARRFHDAKSALERGVFDPHWQIGVFAVPRHLRGEIKVLLLEQALPDLVHPWLMARGNLTGKTGESALILEYVRTDKAFKSTTRDEIVPDRSQSPKKVDE